MMFPRLSSVHALAALFCLASLPAIAGPAWDVGARGSIYDETYSLGAGAELGAVFVGGGSWDWGAHLIYSHYASQVANVSDEEEFGGYVAAYYKPQIDQAFRLRLGPHLGYSHLLGHHADVGADVMALIAFKPTLEGYLVFTPAYLIGENSQPMVRLGLGLEFGSGR